MASNTDRAGILAVLTSTGLLILLVIGLFPKTTIALPNLLQPIGLRYDLLFIAMQPATVVLESMTEENESSEIAENAAAKKGEVGGRTTRIFSVCPNCGARHNTVNDTKGVWICPDCGKPYDPY